MKRVKPFKLKEVKGIPDPNKQYILEDGNGDCFLSTEAQNKCIEVKRIWEVMPTVFGRLRKLI